MRAYIVTTKSGQTYKVVAFNYAHVVAATCRAAIKRLGGDRLSYKEITIQSCRLATKCA